MQNKDEYNLPLRSRYYQAQIDVTSLKSGDEYKDLKPLYVIFICNFDPFGKELYRYTFSMQCEEGDFPLDDGVKRIFYNTKGKNREEVPKILIDFLGYLNDSTDTYAEQDLDEKVKQIHERVKLLKKNRDVEKNYMHYISVAEAIAKLEEIAEEAERKAEEAERKAEETERAAEERLRKAEEANRRAEETARAAAEREKKAEEANRKAEETERAAEEREKKAEEANRRAEEERKEVRKIIKDLLFDSIAELGVISEEIHERIEKEEDINILKSMNKAALKAESMEQFEKQIVSL